jgi:serine/threonine protein phosphatase 1
VGLRLYAIGDVHGHAGALRDVFARIDADRTERPLPRSLELYLGDYVDRGPASRDVLNLLLERRNQQELVLLKGNHEVLFLQFFDDPSLFEVWRQNGGLSTLMSYGLKPSFKPTASELRELAQEFRRVVPRAHREMLMNAPASFEFGDLFFVHAGVRPGIPLHQQKEDDLLWIREDFLLHERAFEKIVVHGHTQVPVPEVLFNRINLDTGAYATGRLACVTFDHNAVGFI